MIHLVKAGCFSTFLVNYCRYIELMTDYIPQRMRLVDEIAEEHLDMSLKRYFWLAKA